MVFSEELDEKEIELLQNKPIKTLLKNTPTNIKQRIVTALAAAKINTLGDLINYKDKPISEIRGIGELAMKYIIKMLRKNGIEFSLEELGIEEQKTEFEYLLPKMKDGTATPKDMKYLGLDQLMYKALARNQIGTLDDLLKRIKFEEDFEQLWGITSENKSIIIDFLAQYGFHFPSHRKTDWNNETPIRILNFPGRIYNYLMKRGIDTLGKLKESKISSTVLYDLAMRKEPNDDAIKIIEKIEELGFIDCIPKGDLLVELNKDIDVYNDGMRELAVPAVIRKHIKTVLDDMELQKIEMTDFNKIQNILEYMNDCTDRIRGRKYDEKRYLRGSGDIIESGERYDSLESAVLFADLARAAKIPTVLVNALDIRQGKKYERKPELGLREGIVFPAVYANGPDGKKSWYIINPDKEVSEEKRVRIAKYDVKNRRVGNYYVYAFVRHIDDISYHGKRGNTGENRQRIQEYVWQNLPEEVKRSFETNDPDPTDNDGER